MARALLAILFLHAAVEGSVGLVLLAHPAAVVPGVAPDALPYLLYYGAAAITFALAVAWLWPVRRQAAALGLALGLFATFHSLLALAGVRVALVGGGWHIAVNHGLFAAAFWFFWRRRVPLP